MRKQQGTISVSFEDLKLNRAAAPPSRSTADHDLNLRAQEHEALKDASSLDLASWQTMNGANAPGERKLKAWCHTKLQEASTAMVDVQSISDALSTSQHAQLIVNGPGIRETRTTLATEKQSLQELEGEIASREEKRASLTAVLDGRATDAEGVMWTGTTPSKPSVDTGSLAQTPPAFHLRGKRLSLVLIAGLIVIEGAITANNIKDYMRVDQWILPVALSLGFLLLLVGMPAAIGRKWATISRQEIFNPKGTASLIFSLSIWISAVAASVYFRVTHDKDAAVLRSAAQNHIPFGEVQANEVYNMPMSAFSWAIAVGAFGVLVMVVERLNYNPIISEVRELDRDLATLYRRRNLHLIIVRKAEALVSATKQAAEAVLQAWEHYRDFEIPAQADELAEHYRGWLIRTYNDPEITEAIMGRGV